MKYTVHQNKTIDVPFFVVERWEAGLLTMHCICVGNPFNVLEYDPTDDHAPIKPYKDDDFEKYLLNLTLLTSEEVEALREMKP